MSKKKSAKINPKYIGLGDAYVNIAKSGVINDPTRSFDPSLAQSTYQSSFQNFRNTFYNSIDEIQKSRYQGEILDKQKQIDERVDRLKKDRNLNEYDRAVLYSEISGLQQEILPKLDEIKEQEADIADSPVDMDYAKRLNDAQLEEGSNILHYVATGELAQDLGGSASEIGSQLASILGPIGARKLAKSIAIKAAMSAQTGLAAPYVAAGLTALETAAFLGSAYLTYQQRAHETASEKADAFNERYSQAVKNASADGQIELNEDQLREIRLNTYKGLETVEKANMNLMLQDAFQTALLAAPWLKSYKYYTALTKGLNATRLSRGATAAAGLGVEMISEGQEEAIQNLVAGRYKRGDYDDVKDTGTSFGNLEQMWDLGTETTKALFGASSDALTHTAEYRNNFRSGLIIGGLLGGAFKGYEAGKDLIDYSKTKTGAESLLNSSVKDEENATKISIIDNFRKNTKDYIIDDVFNNLEQSKLETISSDDIKNAKEYTKEVVDILNTFDSNKDFAYLQGNKEARVHAANLLITAKQRIKEANSNISNLEKANEDIYKGLSEPFVSNKPSTITADEVAKLRTERLHIEALGKEQLSNIDKQLSEIAAQRDFEINRHKERLGDLSQLTDIEKKFSDETVSNITSKFDKSISELNKIRDTFNKTTRSKMADLSLKIKSKGVDNINISDPEIKALNKLKNGQISADLKLEQLAKIIEEKHKNSDGSDLAKNELAYMSKYAINLALEADKLEQAYNDKLNSYADQIAGFDSTDEERNHIKKEVEKNIATPKDKDIQSNLAKILDNEVEAEQFKSNLTSYSNPFNLIKAVKNYGKVFEAGNPIVNEAKVAKDNKTTIDNIEENDTVAVGGQRAIVVKVDNDSIDVQHIDVNGEPIGGVATYDKNVVSLLNKTSKVDEIDSTDKISSDELPDNADDVVNRIEYKGKEFIIRHPLASIYDAISYSSSEGDDIKSRNEDFEEWIITNKANKDKVQVEFIIDYDNQFFKLNQSLAEQLKSGKFNLTDPKNTEKIGLIPIKLSISYGDNVFDNELYYHSTDYVLNPNTRVTHLHPKTIEREDGVGLENSRVIESRREILNTLLSGNKAISTGVDIIGKGSYNNTGNNQIVSDAFNQSTTEIGVSVANGEGNLVSNVNQVTRLKGNGVSPGTVVLTTNRTFNSNNTNVKANISNLSTEHANILFNAILNRYAAGKSTGYRHVAKIEGVEGLSVGEVMDLLVTYGEATSPIYANNESKWKERGIFDQMLNKQLYVTYKDITLEDGSVKKNQPHLIFGTNEAWLNGDRESLRLDFIDWAKQNKRYAVSVNYKSVLGGVQLNSQVLKSFKLGGWEYTYTKDKYMRMSDILLTLPIDSDGNTAIMTDVAVWKNTNSILRSPLIILKTEGGKIKLNKVTSTKVSTPKPTFVNPINDERFKSKTINTVDGKFTYKPVAIESINKLIDGDTLRSMGMSIVDDAAIKKYQIYGDVVVGTVISLDNGAKVLQLTEDAVDTLSQLDIKHNNNQIDINDKASLKMLAVPFRNMYLIESEVSKLDNNATLVNKDVAVAISSDVVENNVNTEEIPAPAEVNEVKEEPKITEKYIDPVHNFLFGEQPKPRLVTKHYKQVANVNKEIDRVRQMIGNKMPITVVDDFITLLGKGKRAHATFERNLITLSNIMEEGSSFHEAFHMVFNLYLTKPQQDKVLQQARVRYSRQLGFNATKNDIEELLAEEFRVYVLSNDAQRSNNWLGAIKSFFSRLYNYIIHRFSNSFPLSSLDIDGIFEGIYDGKFKYSTAIASNYDNLEGVQLPLAIKDYNIASIETSSQLQSLIKSLASSTLILNNIKNLGDVSNISFSLLHKDLLNKIANNIGNVNLYKEIVSENNFGLFVRLINSYLHDFGISAKDNDDFADVANSDIEKYDKAPYEVSDVQNANKAVKFIISILPNNKVDEWSGLVEFGNFSHNWKEIMRNFNSVQSVDDIFARAAFLAETNIKYKALEHILKNSSTEVVNLFHQTVRHHRYSHIDMTITGSEESTVNAFIVDSAIQNEISRLVNAKKGGIWGSNLTRSDLMIYEKGVRNRLDKSKYDELVEYKNNIIDDLSDAINTGNVDNTLYVNKLVDLLSKVGIVIDANTVDNMIYKMQSEFGISDYSKALLSYLVGGLSKNQVTGEHFGIDRIIGKNTAISTIASGKPYKSTLLSTNKNDVFLTAQNVLGDEAQVKTIAKYFAEANVDKLSNITIGPEGNAYFQYSEHTIVTDTFNELKNNPQEIELKLNSINNASSFILKALQDESIRNSVQLVHFSAFREGEGDSGTEYVKLNSKNNYLVKLIGTLNNFILFPVLASKKAYPMIKGVNRLNVNTFVDNKLDITDEVIEQFYQYYLDEYYRIALVNQQIRKEETDQNVTRKSDSDVDVIDNIDVRNLYENIHYVFVKNKKDADYKVDDRFISFDKAPGNRFNTFTDFNNIEDELTEEDVKARIKESLVGIIDEELKFIESLDISIKSIPNNIVTKVTKEYGSSNALRAIIADSTINQMASILEVEKIISGNPENYKIDKKSGTPVEDQIKRLSVLSSTRAKLVESMEDPYEIDSALSDTQYNVATMYSHKIKSMYYDNLHGKLMKSLQADGYSHSGAATEASKILDPYNASDTTDAQVFITPKMYRQIKLRLGEWSKEHQDAWDILTSDSEMSIKDEIKARGFFMEPLKMVYFGHNYDSELDVVTYDKMSLATLFKRDIKDTQLEPLFDRMTKEGDEEVHMIKFDSAVKAGNRARTEFYKPNGIDNADYNKLYVYKQDWKYLGRQLLTDPHEEERQKAGTQMLKVLLGAIRYDKKYENGITGREIANEIYTSISALSDFGRQEVLNKFGLKNDYTTAVNEALADFLRDEAEKGNMSDNIIDSLRVDDKGDFVVNLDALAQKDWIYNRMISYITKKTIDLNLPGKALIQTSNIGFRSTITKFSDANKDAITWLKEDTSELKFYNYDSTGKLQFMEAAVSISLFKDIIPNYKSISFDEASNWLKDNPEIIGYRIPTQGLGSVVGIKVVGFLHESAGDSIILPSEFPALTGSDFDIDKLYTIRKNYEISSKGNSVEVQYITKSKSELDIENEIKNSTITDAYKHDVESRLKDLTEFRFKYKRKLAEYFMTNYSTIVKKESPEVTELSKFIDSYFELQDSLRSNVTQLKVELDNLTEQLKSTTDPILKEHIESNIQNVRTKIFEDRKAASRINLKSVIQLAIKKNFEVVKNLSISDGFYTEFEFAVLPTQYQNSREAVENNLINQYISILKSDNSTIQAIKPNGTIKHVLETMASEVAKRTGKLRKLSSLKRLSPEYQSQVKDNFTGGKNGVGPAALHNSHHSLAISAKLIIKDIKESSPYGKNVYDEKGIYLGKSLYETVGKDGVVIHDWLSALIDAFVDIEKDPYITDLNVNNETYGVTYLLLRLGEGKKAFNILTSDNVIAYCKDLQSGNTSKIESWDVENIPELSEFVELQKIARGLDDAVKVSQVDTKKFGSTLAEVRSFTALQKRVFDLENFINLDKIVPYDFNNNEIIHDPDATHMGSNLDNSLVLLEKIFKNKMLAFTDGHKVLYETVLSSLGMTNTTKKETINTVAKEVFTEIISEFYTSPEYLGLSNEYIKSLISGNNSIANKVFDIYSGNLFPELKNMVLFKALMSDFSESGEYGFIKPPVSREKDSKWDTEMLRMDIESLFKHQNADIRKFANDLLIYSYFSSGEKFGIYSMFSHMPVTAKIELKGANNITYNDFLYKKLQEFQDSRLYASKLPYRSRDILKNNWYNKLLTPTLPTYITNDLRKRVYSINPKNFIKKSSTDKKSTLGIRMFKVSKEFIDGLFIGVNSEGQRLYKPFINYNYNFSDGSNISATATFIGYDSKTLEPVYKSINRTSYSKAGFVWKENGLTVSTIESNNLPEGVEVPDNRIEEFMNIDVVKDAISSNFIRVHYDDQIVNLSLSKGIKKQNDVNVLTDVDTSANEAKTGQESSISDDNKTTTVNTNNVENTTTITQEQLDSINAKFIDSGSITMEEFNQLSEQEKQNLLNCL